MFVVWSEARKGGVGCEDVEGWSREIIFVMCWSCLVELRQSCLMLH